MPRVLVVAVAALLVSMPAHAQSAPPVKLASYSFAAESQRGLPTVVRVTLQSNRRLFLQLHEYQQEYAAKPVRVTRQTVRLSNAVFDSLLPVLRVLARAETVENHSDYVCFMNPGVLHRTGELGIISSYDPEVDQFSGEIETFMTGAWCWSTLHVGPVVPEFRNAGEHLKTKLRVLASQLLGRRIRTILYERL